MKQRGGSESIGSGFREIGAVNAVRALLGVPVALVFYIVEGHSRRTIPAQQRQLSSPCVKRLSSYDVPPQKNADPSSHAETAHRDLRISPAEFDEVAAELGRSPDFAKVPKREKAKALAAFAAHKDEVTAGSISAKRG